MSSKVSIYLIIILILLLLVSLDHYSYKGIVSFRKYADYIVQPGAIPFFTFHNYIQSFFERFTSRSLLISTMEEYSTKIATLTKENELLKNQLSIYKYIFKSYSNFSNIPNLHAGIFEVKLMLNNVFILNKNISKAYAIDSDGNFIGIVEGNKLYTLYDRAFKCKIKVNDDKKFGILENMANEFKIKYLQNIKNGDVYLYEDNIEIPIGKLKNGIFYPYFKLHYIPKVILLWEGRSL
jgi:hypothetical protein